MAHNLDSFGPQSLVNGFSFQIRPKTDAKI